MAERSIPCAVYRGGTSRGLFFKEADLPILETERHRIFMSAIDAYNPSQVNGLGSGTSHTSKVITVRPSEREDACLDYTFYQVGIGQAIVDAEGTCGNLMAAVGAYAIDEGYAGEVPSVGMMKVAVFNTNIQRLIELNVPVEGGRAKTAGDYHMPGLVKPGARISVSILSPSGGKTGELFPAGQRIVLHPNDEEVTVTISDLVNPFVFAAFNDFNLAGSELNEKLSANEQLVDTLETLRRSSAVAAGMSVDEEAAGEVPSIPKVALVSAPCDYVTTSGRIIHAYEVDIIARMVSMGKFHRTFAGSGLYNLAAMTLLEGTVPHYYARKKDSNGEGRGRQVVRIGHPDGIAEVMVELTEDGKNVLSVGLDRTARRIMDGRCYVEDWTEKGEFV